jgi:hypothetical protein
MKRKIIITIVFLIVFILLVGIFLWKYLFEPPRYDISVYKYICRDGTFASTESLDNHQCLDCVTKTAYICGDKFWIHEWGGLPGNIKNKWSRPYTIDRLEEFKEPLTPP